MTKEQAIEEATVHAEQGHDMCVTQDPYAEFDRPPFNFGYHPKRTDHLFGHEVLIQEIQGKKK